MECPKCGYMLSAFDKDCPRCKTIRGKSDLNPYVQHQQESLREAMPNASEPKMPDFQVKDSPVSRSDERPMRRGVPLSWLVIGVPVILVLCFIVVNASGGQHDADISEGYKHCSAGDEYDCTGCMDRLNRDGDASDAQYLEKCLIVGKYINGCGLLGNLSEDVENTGGFSTMGLVRAAGAAIYEGDNSSVYDACKYLLNTSPPYPLPPLPYDVHPASANATTPAPAPPAGPPSPDTSSGTSFTMRTKAGGGATPDLRQFR